MTIDQLKQFKRLFNKRVLPNGVKRWNEIETVDFALITLTDEQLLELPYNMGEFCKAYKEKYWFPKKNREEAK